MELSSYESKIPSHILELLKKRNLATLRPCQYKSIDAGLFEGKNLLVCTPTASGKTLVAEMAAFHTIKSKKRIAIYIVPLKALASEKYKQFTKFLGDQCKVALSIGDTDSSDTYLANYDLIITTSEKLDSLIRHHAPWFGRIGCAVIDEAHLLNDADRGPTLEIVMTIMRQQLKELQIVALSATVGNPEEFASWLDAKLIVDHWRPVVLHKGIYFDQNVQFY
jgi:helicase